MNNRIVSYNKAFYILTLEYNKNYPHVEKVIDAMESHSEKLLNMQLKNIRFKNYLPFRTKMKEKSIRRNLRNRNPMLL